MRGWRQWPDAALRTVEMVRLAAWAAVEHDALTVAQATAYSAMVALFPALIVAAAFVAWVPDTTPLRAQMAQFFDQVLPSNVTPLLETYFSPAHRSAHTVRALLGAVVVSATGASSVMLTLMEGFRAVGGGEPSGGVWPFHLAMAGGRGDAGVAGACAGGLIRDAVDDCVRGERGNHRGDLSPGDGFNKAHARTSGAAAAGAVGDAAEGLELAGELAGCGTGDGFVAGIDAALWVVRDALCGLLEGVRVSGRGDCIDVLVVHYRAERAAGCGVQCAAGGTAGSFAFGVFEEAAGNAAATASGACR
jgi:hypothetical protein